MLSTSMSAGKVFRLQSMQRIICILLATFCVCAMEIGAEETKEASLARLKGQVPGANVTINAGQIHISSIQSPLTKEQGFGVGARDDQGVVRSFLGTYPGLFGHGAEVLDQSKLQRDDTSPSGLHTLVWQQEKAGIPVHNATIVANLGKTGALVAINDSIPKSDLSKTVSAVPTLSADAALQAAVRNCGGAAVNAVILTSSKVGDATLRQELAEGGAKGKSTAKLTWLIVDGEPILCWNIIFTSKTDDLMQESLVDATSGTVLSERSLTIVDKWTKPTTPAPNIAPKQNPVPKNLIPQIPEPIKKPQVPKITPSLSKTQTSNLATDIRLRCFAWPNESPRPLLPGQSTPLPEPAETTRTLVDPSPFYALGSPNGWVSGTTTTGNNVDAYLDVDNNNLPDTLRPIGTGSPLTFDFPLNLSLAPTGTDYRKAAVVNLFYWCNYMHDQLYRLGFTESAGNFQIDNLGNGGLGNDSLNAEAQDGSGTNNANMSTPPDGINPRMQMFIFNGMTPNRDGDFDATVVIHEYCHGLSWRLVGGGAGVGSTLQAGGLGEGWSDFYPCALLSQETDPIAGNYITGGYLTQNYYRGIRHYPYTTDMAKNPYTLVDIANLNEVHYVGEVWCTVLWEMRCALVTKYGFAIGNPLALRLVTDGMKLLPSNPTFIQARDAILSADVATNNGDNLKTLWEAFTKRGLGINASVPNDGSTAGTVEDTTSAVPEIFTLLPSASGSEINLVGDPGGPFINSAPTITLRNLASGARNWSASSNVSWLTLSSAGGQLLENASVQIGITTNANTAVLARGSYSGTITIQNTTNGSGNTTIPVTLAVCLDYTVSSATYSWIDPTAHTLFTGVPDDGVSNPQTIPFSFRFYDRVVTQFWISTNGMIGFKSAAGMEAWENTDLPSSGLPRGIFCGYWDDLNPSIAGARLSIGVEGSAPNRKQVITWTNVPHVLNAYQGFTFQIILEETTNAITVQYKDVRPTLQQGAGRLATVGIEQDSGLRATKYSFNGSPLLANLTAFKFAAKQLVPPDITTQPANVTALVGTTATFTVVVAGDPTPTLQWERSNNGGVSWTPISGATATTYTTGTLSLSDTGAQFRVIATNVAGAPVTSYAAILTVRAPAAIVTPPWNQGVIDGGTAIFTVVVSGSPNPDVQWQQSTDNGSTWTDIGGAIGLSYSVVGTSGNTGTLFRVKASNAVNTVYSSSALLTVSASPVSISIITQPATQAVVLGQTAIYTVVAIGVPTPTLQWQRWSGSAWVNESSVSATTPFFVTNPTILADDGAQFRVVLTNSSGSVSSAAAGLIIYTVPTFSVSPADQSVLIGSTATFSATALGSPTPTLQWERQEASSSTWTTLSGATGISYTTNATVISDSGAKFRVIATNAAGSTTSATAMITVLSPPAFSPSPVDQTVLEGKSASFSCVVTGTPTPTLLWEYQAPSTSTWISITSATSAIYTIPVTTLANSGTKYRVTATNTLGSAVSAYGTLVVQTVPLVVSQPATQAILVGQTATFTVGISGVPTPSIQWQWQAPGGLVWIDITGANGLSYVTPSATLGANLSSYRAVITNAQGSCSSSSARLLVTILPVPWAPGDIGAVGLAGSSSSQQSVQNGLGITLAGSGADIWGTADALHFAGQQVSGDVTIVARLNSMSNTHDWAKAGLMIRNDLTPGSPHAMVAMSPTKGSSLVRRSVASGPSSLTIGRRSIAAPRWLKLERLGNTITGYESPDGISWTRVGGATWTQSLTIYIGCAVSAHNNSALNTAAFDLIQITPSGTN